jgi:hypothetical protein
LIFHDFFFAIIDSIKDALLKFVDGKLGNRKVNPRLQHPTQSLATKGVPKIGLISSGTLQKNTVLEQINRGTVKGRSRLHPLHFQ